MNMDHRNKGHAMSRVAALVFSSMVLFFVEGCVDAGSLPLDTIKLPPVLPSRSMRTMFRMHAV